MNKVHVYLQHSVALLCVTRYYLQIKFYRQKILENNFIKIWDFMKNYQNPNS